MHQKLSGIIKRDEFVGSWEKLRDLVAKAGIDGDWKDFGSFKRLTLHDFNPPMEEIYFWPDTGRVLHCYYYRVKPSRQSAIDWYSMRNPNTGGKRWRTYKFPGFGRLSLPELLIKRPRYAFEEIVFGKESVDDLDPYELAELFDKIMAIRIPRRFSKWARAITSYSPHHSEHLGFEISEEPVWKSRMNDIWVSRHIDLCDTCVLFLEGVPFLSPIPSLMCAVAGDPSIVWDRQQCEKFLDDPRNFIRSLKPFDLDGVSHNGIRILHA